MRKIDKVLAGLLRLVWRAGTAIDEGLPEWTPPTPRWIDRGLAWCLLTAKRLAPTPEEQEMDRLFDAVLGNIQAALGPETERPRSLAELLALAVARARPRAATGTVQSADLRIVRHWDMFDGWIDLTGPISAEEALRIWNEKTEGGTRNTKYDDGDYYRIFPADTRMVVTADYLGR